MKITSAGFWLGIGMTLVLALIGKAVAYLPFFSILGPMVVAILLGMAWTTLSGGKWTTARADRVGQDLPSGYVFASKFLLRAGIIVLGVRLDLVALGHAGIRVLGTEIVLVALTLLIGYGLARRFGVERRLAMVAAAGTAICGAAAAAAIAVQVRAKSEHTVLGVATVAVLGTVFTLLDTLLYPLLGLTPQGYGFFTGATLHEVAHVIAAASPLGAASLDTAILVKLTRVVLLAPVAIFVGWWFARTPDNDSVQQGVANDTEAAPRPKVPIPWFVFGFLIVGALHTWHLLPAAWTPFLVQASLFLMTMGMAGLGLQVNIKALHGGGRVIGSALITSVLLAIAGFAVARLFSL